MKIKILLSTGFLILSVILVSCSNSNKVDGNRISCSDFPQLYNIITGAEMAPNFVDFCENNPSFKFENCKDSSEEKYYCRFSVGVQSSKIENCNNNDSCEFAFKATHLEDCNLFKKDKNICETGKLFQNYKNLSKDPYSISKPYTNQEYGFSLDLPKGWYHESSGISPDFVGGYKHVLRTSPWENSHGWGIVVSVVPTTIEDFLTNQIYDEHHGWAIAKRETIQIKGFSGEKVSHVRGNPSYLIESPDKSFTLEFVDSNNWPEFLDFINSIKFFYSQPKLSPSKSWKEVNHENFWNTFEPPIHFPNVEFSYPSNWKFYCCLDADDRSSHIIYTSTEENNNLPRVIITDYMLYEGYYTDEFHSVTPQKRLETIIKEIPDNVGIKTERFLENLSVNAFNYVDEEGDQVYIFHTKDGVIKVSFVNFDDWQPDFINEFLNKLRYDENK